MTQKKRPILVAIGDSDTHDAALRFAADEAVRDRRPLHLAHVIHAPREDLFPEQMLISFSAVELAAGSLLRSQVDHATHLTGGVVPVTQTLRRGAVVDQLVELSEEAHHVVVQHRQRSRLARVFTGSTAAGVAAHAAAPLVSVPELWSGPSNRDVVVAIDRVGTDDTLLRYGVDEARRRDARLVVLHAWYVPDLYGDALVDRAELHHTREGVRARIEAALLRVRADHPQVDVRVELVHMRPADAVVERSSRTDILVLGRSWASPGSSRLGSVTRAALREATCPVAVVDGVAVAPAVADPSDARHPAGVS
jgi:nucleotide-binding universal stress UspA family protein